MTARAHRCNWRCYPGYCIDPYPAEKEDRYMTLHATRSGQSITICGPSDSVRVTDGRVEHVQITENAQHVRYFHGELGKLLDAADEEREAAQPEPL